MVRDSILADERCSRAESWLAEEDTNRGKEKKEGQISGGELQRRRGEKELLVGFGKGEVKRGKEKRKKVELRIIR